MWTLIDKTTKKAMGAGYFDTKEKALKYASIKGWSHKVVAVRSDQHTDKDTIDHYIFGDMMGFW